MALNMAGEEPVLHTPIEWAQRKDRVFLTLVLEDCKKPTVELTDTGLHFKGRGGSENKLHEAKIDFFKEIDSKESKYVVLPRHITMVLKKKDTTDEHFWPRLLKEKVKVHWLKTDFNKWKDEDDSDYEDAGPGDMDLESMMQNMGGMGGMQGMGGMPGMEGDMMMQNMAGMGGMQGVGGMPGMEENMGNDQGSSDSDDEDLPDLE